MKHMTKEVRHYVIVLLMDEIMVKIYFPFLMGTLWNPSKTPGVSPGPTLRTTVIQNSSYIFQQPLKNNNKTLTKLV